jgi:hypothetical protein
MSYVLTSTICEKGGFKMPNIDIDNYVEEDLWEYSNECNKWEGGGTQKQLQTQTE